MEYLWSYLIPIVAIDSRLGKVEKTLRDIP